jgi:dimethylsulfone monooxygenase
MDSFAAGARTANALFSTNKLKLGTFATNVSNAAAITTLEGRFETTWPNVTAIAHLADEARFEAMVPVARWRGFGGQTNFNGANFETYTWAAGLAAVTRNVTLFSTSHVPTIHPIVAAKQATTIDHISNGRFALNIVCGWFEPEFRMFGSPMMDHDAAYEYAAEWITVVKHLWTCEEEFDFEGKYFRIEKGFHQPKPIQRPFPALMNAGSSQTGRHFASKYCDMAFTQLRGSPDTIKAQIQAFRDLARNEYGREIQIWGNACIVQGDSEKDARAFHDYYVDELGDWEAVENMFEIMGIKGKINVSGEALHQMKREWIAGWGGSLMIGTAEMIVERLDQLSKLGVDGCVLTFPRYEQGLRRFIEEVLPLTIQAGLRKAA